MLTSLSLWNSASLTETLGAVVTSVLLCSVPQGCRQRLCVFVLFKCSLEQLIWKLCIMTAVPQIHLLSQRPALLLWKTNWKWNSERILCFYNALVQRWEINFKCILNMGEIININSKLMTWYKHDNYITVYIRDKGWENRSSVEVTYRLYWQSASGRKLSLLELLKME